MTVHALSGLPRSGSTLVGNILAQHPDVSVSGTSALYDCVAAIMDALTSSDEVRSDLANVPGSYDRYLGAMRQFVDGWHSHQSTPVIVDKSRGWLMVPAVLRQLDPESKLVVCVRDPRDVVASIERQNQKTALFRSAHGISLADTVATLMKPEGMVGGALRFCEDLIRRKVPVVWVRYETLLASPEPIMDRVRSALGLTEFVFDFNNIENVATDLDALHLNKYPHHGAGSLKPRNVPWGDVLDNETARRIAVSYPLYMQTFGYD